MFKSKFIQAIHEKIKLRITFFSSKDGQYITRVCAPMDYAPGRNIHDRDKRYWVWDYDSDTGRHTLPLKAERIKTMVVLEDHFDPDEFVTWSTHTKPWAVSRDWGHHS